MGFVLERLTEEQFAVCSSAANRNAAYKAGIHANWENLLGSRKYWAIDRERNVYFFVLSAMDSDDPGADFYLLNFDEHPIVVRIKPGKKVAPLEVPTGLKGRLEDIRSAIRESLSVIGYGGIGVFLKGDAILPEFA